MCVILDSKITVEKTWHLNIYIKIRPGFGEPLDPVGIVAIPHRLKRRLALNVFTSMHVIQLKIVPPPPPASSLLPVLRRLSKCVFLWIKRLPRPSILWKMPPFFLRTIRMSCKSFLLCHLVLQTAVFVLDFRDAEKYSKIQQPHQSPNGICMSGKFHQKTTTKRYKLQMCT